jgi:hypothetical protein
LSVCLYLSISLYSHNSSLGGRRQKPISALNSAGIGEEAKQFFSPNFCPKKLVRSGKSSKNDENEYKSSLGGRRQKPIGALNSARIGEDAKPKIFQHFFKKIGEFWKELKKG